MRCVELLGDLLRRQKLRNLPLLQHARFGLDLGLDLGLGFD